MAQQRDYYQTLGISEKATTVEIKKAFRRLAKQYHPDRNPNNAQAAERFKEINEAHDVLSEPEKRKKYDMLRRYGAFAGTGTGRRRGAGGFGGGPPPDQGIDFDISDLGSFGGLRVVGIAVGVVLLRQTTKRFLDLVGGGGLSEAEGLVVVALRCHGYRLSAIGYRP